MTTHGWLLALGMMVACGSAPATAPLAPAGDELRENQPVEKPLRGGEAHRYHVRLEANRVLLATVDQRGIDVQVTTYDPAGKKLADIDSPNGNKGPEPIVIAAKRAGFYGIEVKPFSLPTGASDTVMAPTPNSKYQIKIDEIRTATVHAQKQLEATIESPRVLALWKGLLEKRSNAAVATFWKDLAGKAPIVEPYPGDDRSLLVTFVFRSKEPYVGLLGGPSAREKPLLRIADTDLWFLTARMPRDTRVDYAFLATDHAPEHRLPFRKGEFPGQSRWFQKTLDPNNPKTSADQSRFEGPDAPALLWIARKPEQPAGKLIELQLDSTHLKEQRKVAIYTPPGHDKTKSYPAVIAFDGEVYGLDPASALIPTPVILDNLIAAGKIPPVVAALVANQGTRIKDLAASPAFADFVALELLPKLRSDYGAGTTPATTLVTGSSLGGVASVHIGLRHSAHVGLVLSQSGAFWWRPGGLDVDLPPTAEFGWLVHEMAMADKLPLRFYLDAGLYESDVQGDILEMNHRMRDVLLAKGYPVRYQEFSGGHDYLVWRGTIADGLIELLGTPAVPVARPQRPAEPKPSNVPKPAGG